MRSLHEIKSFLWGDGAFNRCCICGAPRKSLQGCAIMQLLIIPERRNAKFVQQTGLPGGMTYGSEMASTA